MRYVAVLRTSTPPMANLVRGFTASHPTAAHRRPRTTVDLEREHPAAPIGGNITRAGAPMAPSRGLPRPCPGPAPATFPHRTNSQRFDPRINRDEAWSMYPSTRTRPVCMASGGLSCVGPHRSGVVASPPGTLRRRDRSASIGADRRFPALPARGPEQPSRAVLGRDRRPSLAAPLLGPPASPLSRCTTRICRPRPRLRKACPRVTFRSLSGSPCSAYVRARVL